MARKKKVSAESLLEKKPKRDLKQKSSEDIKQHSKFDKFKGEQK